MKNGGVGYLEGFPADAATYRKHCRGKKKEVERFAVLERQVQAVQQEQLASISQQRESHTSRKQGIGAPL